MSGSHRFSRLMVWLVAIPAGVIVAFFAIANRHVVTVDMWPLPYSVSLPLFLVLIGTVIFGFLLGTFVHWIIAGRLRLRAGRAERRAEAAERELERLRLAAGEPARDSQARLSHAA